MSTSAPLVRGSHEGGVSPSSSDDPWRDEPCGLKKYKNITVCAVVAFFLVGFALIIWVSVRSRSQDNPPVNSLASFGINQMFDRSLNPQRASLAWINQGDKDQYISIVNGSFYLTTLPAFSLPVLLIDAADLNKFAPLTPPVKPSSAAATRRLMSFDAKTGATPDAASLREESPARSTPRPVRPVTPRALRPKPAHARRSLPHSAAHEQHPAHHPLHAQSADHGASLDAAPATFIFQSYSLSPDQHAMLFGVNCIQLYRHSSFCDYYIYDIAAKTMTPLVASGSQLRLAVWSPTSGKIAYVQDDNIFLFSLAAPLAAPVVVTTDGQWNHIINGVQSWVYEEEIFEATSALWWAPDGASLAFMHFNQSAVPIYEFDFYTSPYNLQFSYKYPKAGAENSVVDVRVFNLTSAVVHTFPELRAAYDYEYIMNVAWFDSSALMVRVENRAQNEWRLYKLQTNAAATSPVTALSAATAAWYFEPQDCLTSLAPLPYYVDLVNSDSSAGVGRGDHVHLALYSSVDGSFRSFLTSGDFDVLSLDSVVIDAAAGSATIYYTREMHQTDAAIAVPTLWKTSSATLSNGTDAVQLFPTGSALTQQSGSYSPSGSYALLQESAGIPTSTLYALNSSLASVPRSLAVLADNTALIAKLAATYAIPTTTYTQIDSTLPGLKLSLSILSPAGLDLSACGGQRPVLLYAYSGPGSQEVSTAFPLGYGSMGSFHASLVSQYGFIVVVVDTVGTKGKGEAYRKSHTYKRLGMQEQTDMIATAQWVRSQCWADSTRISHWGWSYGAFMSATVAAQGTGLYEHLISVAPVTDWALYDSVYTERYMLRPIDNPIGYANSSVIAAASTRFDSEVWRLFGGTADDVRKRAG